MELLQKALHQGLPRKKPGRTCLVCRKEGLRREMKKNTRHLHELKEGDFFRFEGTDSFCQDVYLLESTKFFGSYNIRDITLPPSEAKLCAPCAQVVQVKPQDVPEVKARVPGFKKVRKEGEESPAAFCRRIILAGASDEEVTAQVQEAFPDYNSWKIAARVYRKQLLEKGLLDKA
jgi:hypothetical protein